MGEMDSRKREGRFSGLSSVLRRQSKDRVEINGYRVGDIRADNPIVVARDAILIGDLLAPEVYVSGVVYGYIACRRLVVAPDGQIWGDVYINTIEMAPAGKIHGWVCTLDAGTVDLLRAGELGAGDLPDQDDYRLPKELIQRIESAGADVEADQLASQRRSGIWRQLRSEAALATIARSEIEATFEERLEDGLAESKAAIINLQEQLEKAQQLEEASDHTPPDSGDAVDSQSAAEIERLSTQLRQATAAAQKYYGELLWARAELRAAKRDDGGQ